MSTIRVPGGDAAALSAAVVSAVAGDEIVLGDGVFLPSAQIDTADKNITIRSESGDPTACIVDGGGTHRCFFVHDKSNYNPPDNPESVVTKIRGIGIRNGYINRTSTGRGGGGSIGGWFENCIFDNCMARGSDCHGGALYQPDGCVRCVFRNCTSNCHSGALQVEPKQSYAALFAECLFIDCYSLRAGYTVCANYGKYVNCTFFRCVNPDFVSVYSNTHVCCFTVAYNNVVCGTDLYGTMPRVRISHSAWNMSAPTASDMACNALDIPVAGSPYDAATTYDAPAGTLDGDLVPSPDGNAFQRGNSQYLYLPYDLDGIPWRTPPSLGCRERPAATQIPTRLFPLGID